MLLTPCAELLRVGGGQGDSFSPLSQRIKSQENQALNTQPSFIEIRHEQPSALRTRLPVNHYKGLDNLNKEREIGWFIPYPFGRFECLTEQIFPAEKSPEVFVLEWEKKQKPDILYFHIKNTLTYLVLLFSVYLPRGHLIQSPIPQVSLTAVGKFSTCFLQGDDGHQQSGCLKTSSFKRQNWKWRSGIQNKVQSFDGRMNPLDISNT